MVLQQTARGGAKRYARPSGGTRSGARKGQSVVEFALAAPIFFALLLGIVEMGLVFKTRAAYQEAAQQAARAASVVGGSDQDGLAQLRATLVGENLNSIQSVTIYDSTVTGAVVNATPPLTTSTTYDYIPSPGASPGGFVCHGEIPPNNTPPCASSWTVRHSGASSPDRLGVRIIYRYNTLRGVFPPLTLTEIATALLEPQSYDGSSGVGP